VKDVCKVIVLIDVIDLCNITVSQKRLENIKVLLNIDNFFEIHD
jgi:hypothetical protein